jgi:serine/threonine protein kinase/Flp pilus assembly protein TadD
VSEGQRPPDDQEPTHLVSDDFEGADDSTRAGGKEDANTSGNDLPSKRLGDFDLLREIGRGGMGIVYEARQISLNRRVALKILPPGLGLTENAVQRFGREARAAAKLHHTNIVPVHAIGEEAGHHYYAMELIEGLSLAQILADVQQEETQTFKERTMTRLFAGVDGEPEPSEERRAASSSSRSGATATGRKWFDIVARQLADVADALDHAHGRGVIHRDIKPANLLLSPEGRLCITDFGLARIAQEPGMTTTGAFLGTPSYMSPEQARGHKVDHRSDIYSLGVVLYEMLTLRRPFTGESWEKIVHSILTRDPVGPRRINSRVPNDLETICLKALEKDPDRRYAAAAEFAEDLRRYLQHGLIKARRASLARRSWKSIRRHPVAWTAAALTTLLIVLVGGVGGFLSAQRAEESARRALADAHLAVNEGLYSQALEIVDGVLAAKPDLGEARVLRARLLMKSNRVLDAVTEAKGLLNDDPDDWTAHLILARAANSIHVLGLSAEEHVRAVESMAPETAEAYYLRSLLADSSSQAVELLNRALELDPDDNEALVARINRYEALKDHPAALQDCERLIVARPRSAQGRRMRARIELARSDLETAMREVNRAIELDAEDARNFELRARIHQTAGRFDEALADRDRAIELAPDNAHYMRRRAEVRLRTGQFEEAIADARRALELNPDERVSYAVLFRANRSLDRTQQGREVLDELRLASAGWADKEARAWAHRRLSDYERRLHDYDRALADATRAVEIDPGDFRNYLTRASVRRRSGDRDGFRADCDAAARLGLDDPEDLEARAKRLGRDCKRWDQALAEYDRLVERTPNWHLAHHGRGTASAFLGNLEGAATDFTRAIELAPSYQIAYNNRAAAYSILHRYPEALVDLRRAIALNPHDGLARSNMADTLEQLGRLDEAIAECDRAIEIDPLRWNAHAQRGGILAALGACDQAMSSLSRAEELAGEDSQLHEELAGIHTDALIHFCADSYDAPQALAHARRAAEAAPDDPRAASSLGAALFRHGRYAEARNRLEQAVEAADEAGARESLYLAMVAWRLGDREAARQYREQASEFMDSRSVRRPSLVQLRSEAARIIGPED